MFTPNLFDETDTVVFVPEGHPKIAQRFIAGGRDHNHLKSRRDDWAVPEGFSRPFGTGTVGPAILPSSKLLGYCRMSLRDKDRLSLARFNEAIHWIETIEILQDFVEAEV